MEELNIWCKMDHIMKETILIIGETVKDCKFILTGNILKDNSIMIKELEEEKWDFWMGANIKANL